MAHLNTFHLFAGAGGGILADLLLGHNPIGACEIEKYPREVLLARQRDGYLPEFPIWDDVCTLDGNHWKGSVDVLCGGFPCQDISAAGKRAGIAGERSGLWKEYARLIREMRPRFVFAENSPLLRTRGLGVVLEDLAALGYDARWGVLGAGAVGAPHKRDRMWVLAYANCKQDDSKRRVSECGWNALGRKEHAAFRENRKASANSVNGQSDAPEMEDSRRALQSRTEFREKNENEVREGYSNQHQRSGSPSKSNVADSDDTGCKKQWFTFSNAPQYKTIECRGYWHTDPAELGNAELLRDGWREQQQESGKETRQYRRARNQENWPTQPIVGRVAHGVAHRVDRLKAIGNGQVPQCAAMAFNILSKGLI